MISKKNALLRLGILFCLVLSTQAIYAQLAEKINYQAVARDTSGKPIADYVMTVDIEILAKSTTGFVDSLVFDETHEITTNRFGLFTLQIGNGTELGNGTVQSFKLIN